MKNKGSFKSSFNLTKKKERREGKGEVRKDKFVACLSKTLRKKREKPVSQLPVCKTL